MSAAVLLPLPDPEDVPGRALQAVRVSSFEDLGGWDDDRLIAEAAVVERAARTMAARAARLGVEFARRHPETSGGPAEDDLSGAALDELSVASGLARGAYAYRLRDAMQLARRFPRLFDAWEAGLVPGPAVRRTLELSLGLSEETCARLDVLLLARIGRPTHNLASMTLRQMQDLDDETAMTLSLRATTAAVSRMVRDLVARLEPQSQADRARRSRRLRRVVFQPDADGLSWLTGVVPEAVGLASYERIDALARAVPEHPDDSRTLDEKRADVYIDLLLGVGVERPGTLSSPATPAPAAGSVPVHVQVLLDHSRCRPGHGGGCVGEAGRLGPVTSDTVVDLLMLAHDTGGAISGGHVTAQPCPGAEHHASHGPGPYEPSEALRRFLRARHRRCTWPGCNRPARACELDHTIPHSVGGPTCECNMGPACVYHHHVKHNPGRGGRPQWRLVNHGAGHLTWVTPGGREIDVWPDPPDDPDPPADSG